MNPFFLISIFFFISLKISPSSSSVNRDLEQLLSFKSKLPNSNPAMTQLSNWGANQNPCSFFGVSCTVEDRVSSIDLSYTVLSTDFASVSSLLMTLDHLVSLSLPGTNLSGSVAVSNYRCSSSLTSVDLSNNGLSGSLSDFSSFFSSCVSVKFVNFSTNSIDSPSGLMAINGIETLDLSFNRISGDKTLDLIVSNGCEKLVKLCLKGNNLNGNVPISKCKSLEYLDLSSNNFSSSISSIFDSNGCLSLKHLDLASNKLFGEDVGKSLSDCQQLSFLNLSSNQFSGSIPTIQSGILQYLYLSNNDFQGNIPPLIAADDNGVGNSCSGLLELDLSFNNLSGTVPSSLASCTALEFIDLSTNNFSGEFPIQTLLKMSRLRRIVLSFNNFVGPLPESLSELANLETLDVSSNNMSGIIPYGLCENPKNRLKELFLPNNFFIGQIPESLGNCSNLVTLDLSFNYLVGTIPRSFGSLTKLRDLIMWLNHLEGEIPTELMYIQALENLILDFNDLVGNIPLGLRNCTNLNWISLSNNRLSGEIPAWIGTLPSLAILKLSNNSFSGRIPPELGDCPSLIWLDLNTNLLNGTIPPSLFKQAGNIAVNRVKGKKYAYIKADGSAECHGAGNLLEFAGIRQEQLTRVSARNPCNFPRVYGGKTEPTFNHNGSMIFLDISFNSLSGTIPKELGFMYYLYILNLGHNDLSGSIPPDLGRLKNLNILDLSKNRLEGLIPQTLAGLTMLIEINLANNNLSGQIPESGQFETMPVYGFLNNSGLCGLPLPHTCGSNSGSNSSNQHQKSHRKQASLVGSVAMGLLFSLFCIFGLIIVAVETKKRRKKKESTLDVYIDSRSHSGTHNNNTNWKLTSAREALSINLATFEKPLQKLTFADLLEATNGFHNDTLVGSGGFGDVYKAILKDGSIVAIKKLIHVSGQGDREFTAEMETIGKIKHRNLVPLLGYCKVGDERLLVYEYMKYGSLDDVLHDKHKNGIKLSWSARRKIAIGAARGLAFLHHNCIPHIIHRDMKSSNVLLDENLEARVSDFGMARMMSVMDTHLSVSTLAGTPGYVPPEYYQSFRCSTKGDVYSYGVVLLELLTGRQPTDNVDFGDNNLVGWVKQHAKLKISDVFDKALLKEDPSLEIELLQHLKVACACLDDRPWRRPTIIQVMTMFKEIQAGSGLNSSSTIDGEDGSFTTEMVEMSIQEGPESKQ